MENEVGLSEEYLAECRLKGARAERTFNKALDEIASRVDLKPEHLAEIRKTKILLACETVPTLEAMLGRLENSGKNPGGKVRDAVAGRLYDLLGWHSKGGFTHISNGGTRSILVGVKGEEAADREYLGGFLSEIGHSIVRSLGEFREGEYTLDRNVSEFYDIAFSWWTDPLGPNALMAILRQHDFYLRHERDREFLKKRAYKVTEVLSSSERASRISAPEAYRALIKPKFSNPALVGGASICYRLAEEVARRKACAPEEVFDDLTGIAGKALYDSAVDFTSPDAFVESVSARLDDYLV